MIKAGIEAQRLFRKKKHGMEVVALETLREIQKIAGDFQFEVFVADDVDHCLHDSEDFKVNVLPAKFYPLWEQKLLTKKAEELKLDLLHCTANTAPLNHKGRLIITIHDLIFLESFEFNSSLYQVVGNLYRRFIVPKVARKAERIITVSGYSKKIIAEKLNVADDKISVVHNGVSPRFKKINDENKLNDFTTKYSLPKNYLLHFGNTAPRKNTRAVLQAYRLYRDKAEAPLPLVVGGCEQELIRNICAKNHLQKLLDHIIIPGYVDAEELPMLYNQATAFLYPSLNEGFGLPVIESMACGTPVVTSNSSCLPEIAGEAALLVDPADPVQIAEGIKKLLQPEVYSMFVERGFINARRFSWKAAAEKTLEIYAQVAAVQKKQPS